MLALQSKPGSGVTVTFAALTCALDSHVARSNRAVWVQQVAWTIVTSGALETAVAVGVELAPGPAPPPRKRTPNTTRAKTNANATRPPCALRSALVYRIA